jgi:disulfide oxidoreductase YuzD
MVYEGEIILTNIEKPNDIRIYKLYVDVKPKEIKATLEFFCPVKETIVQKIPIDNKSDKDWMIKSEITGQTNGYFRVEADKRIPKHSIADILLTFNPTEKINVNGMLKLINNFTSEKYFYTLIGNVEEPLAEGNIEITNINAKESVKKIITIENPLERDVTYTVETDLDDVISGLSTFVAKAQLPYQYEMKIRPLLGKIYFGRIIFRDDNKGYKWYTVRVEAKTQIQPQTIEMRTKIRKGIYIEINLENPTNDSVIFRIDFDSDLFLFGDTDVKVNANSTVVYKLLFAPLKIGVWENVMLHIYNDRIGEFLYKLKLVCEEQPVIFSEIIKAELGKYEDYPILLENPTTEEIEVKSYSSNEKLFKILQEKIFLPSGVKKKF